MKRSVEIEPISFKKVIEIPNELEIARCLKAPEVGPRILFFSGGNGLRELSRDLINYSHNTIHIITPFDSGGSSAKLRDAFHMLSVGDIRNRIMALADTSIKGNPEVYRLFSHRFSKGSENEMLKVELMKMIDEDHELVRAVPNPMRQIIRSHLHFFRRKMPDDFDLRGASIGNLILAGGYLNNDRNIDPVIFLFSKLVEARATVRPVTSEYRHICALLEDGRIMIGQHLITGKEEMPIDSPVKKVYLSQDMGDPGEDAVEVKPKVADLIKDADLICYPMGSFYSSLISNLLVDGVGQEVSENPCMKVYVPSTYNDPELVGSSLYKSVDRLLHYLKRSCSGEVSEDKLLNFVIVDLKRGEYPYSGDLMELEERGVGIIDTQLITDESAPRIDGSKLTEVLLSLI